MLRTRVHLQKKDHNPEMKAVRHQKGYLIVKTSSQNCRSPVWKRKPARKMEEAFLVERTCPSNAWKHLARGKNMSAFWCGVCHKWNAMVYLNQSQRIVQASCTPKSSEPYFLQSDFLRIFLPWEGIDEEGLAKKLLWDLGSAPKNTM